MKEPSLRTSRLALAGGLAAVILVGGGGFLLGRGTSEREVAAAPPSLIEALAPVPTPAATSAPHPVLGRADLIALAGDAGDAAAAGLPVPPAVLEADGRRFELRLPFGCDGPAAADSEGPMRWRYDEQAKALRIHVSPVAWTTEDWWPGAAPTGLEAIEGFWITRPWTASEACPKAGQPPVAVGAEPVTLPGQTLAVAQFFVAGGGRQGRRDGQPFETVERIAPDALRAGQGFRLRLKGRIASVPGDGPALCRQPAGPEQRPICVIAVATDEVAIENPATGETLATWTVEGKSGVGR